MLTEQMVEIGQMAMLEAELQAELERLELNLNSTGSFPDQMMISDIDEADLKEIQNFSNSGMTSCAMHETWDLDRRNNQSRDHVAFTIDCGVSPVELDRRLHEVLEEQQRKRILELERLLKETKTKLLDKEREILFWKDRSHELTKCFQYTSACGNSLNCSSSKDFFLLQADPSGDHMLQDLENNVQSLKYSSTQQRDLVDSSSCKTSLLCDELLELSFEGPMDLVKIVTESHATWHIQGSGIDTPEISDRSMRKLEAHTPFPLTSKSFRSQSVSRGSEMSDLSQLDDLDSATFPSCQINSCFSTSKPCSGTTKNQLQVMDEASAASGHKRIEGKDCFDILEQIVDLPTLDSQSHSPKVLQPRRLLNPEQDAKTLRQSSKLKSEGLQILTAGLRRSFNAQESSSGLQSPVLDKIRHWEALGRGKAARN